MNLISLYSLPSEPLAQSDRSDNELRELLTQHLLALPRRECDALVGAAHINDQSCRSVARRYGVSPQTACNWAKAAAQKLQPHFEAFR